MATFWRWFFHGTGAGSGLGRFWNRWLLFHLGVGLGLAALVPVPLAEAAHRILLPLAGIFVGLTFAWAGNAQALLQVSEIEELGAAHEGGFAEYAFTFQMAVLALLVALVAWGVAGLGVFDRPCWWDCPVLTPMLPQILLYGMSSLVLRECWHVVLGAQLLLLSRHQIRRKRAELAGGNGADGNPGPSPGSESPPDE